MFPYETVELLGSGSYGTVYKVKQKQNSFFAIKRCEVFEEENDTQICSGSVREYIFHQSIREEGLHPSLCTAIKQWKGYRHFYFVLPLFDCNLLEFAREFRHALISFEDFCFFAKKILVAVETLHSKGWIHRDIKPENIYVSRDGSLALGDFNLVRFTDVCVAESQQDLCLSLPRGNSSALVCTLWTRAPELVLGEMQNLSLMETGEEIDAFSVGASLLCLAFGNYVFGKTVRGDSENLTKEYVQGFFSVLGRDLFIDSAYNYHDLDIQPNGLPLFSTAHERLQEYLPKRWTTEQRLHVGKILAALLDPYPTRRASIQIIHELSSVEKLSFPSIKYITNLSLQKKHISKPFLIQPPLDISESFKQSASLSSADNLWSTCGQLRIPIPLAMEAVKVRRTLDSPNTKCILYLLRLVHRFSCSSNWSFNMDNLFAVLPYVKVRKDIWDFTRSLEKEPFLVCCLAAWIHTYGRIPSSKEELMSSKEMNEILSETKIDCFFQSFGQRWKSQKEMLTSWRRLSDDSFEFED